MLALALITLMLSAVDHWTTYLCLRQPISGWQVTEANPISSWLFEQIGLVPGLLLDSGITLLAIGFLLATSLLPRAAKGLCLSLISVWTGYAVLNNLNALETLGLSPLGLS